jgi:hypothetical protein
MEDIFLPPRSGIQCDCRLVLDSFVGLHKNHPAPPPGGNGLQFLDEHCGNTFAPVFPGNSKIINEDLAPLLLELFEFVSGDTSNNSLLLQGDKRYERFTAKQVPQVAIGRTSG